VVAAEVEELLAQDIQVKMVEAVAERRHLALAVVLPVLLVRAIMVVWAIAGVMVIPVVAVVVRGLLAAMRRPEISVATVELVYKVRSLELRHITRLVVAAAVKEEEHLVAQVAVVSVVTVVLATPLRRRLAWPIPDRVAVGRLRQ